MKKLTWLLVTTLTLALAACGGEKKDSDKGGKTGSGDKGDKGGGEIDEAKAAALNKLDVPGFKRLEGGMVMKGMANPVYEQETANATGNKAVVMVNAQPCMMCVPLTVAEWKANENLKSMLPRIHIDNPKLIWEVEEIEAGGKKGISIYHFSFVAEESGKATAHGLMVQYHNGVNQLALRISGRGTWPETEEDLKAAYTKDEMMAVAKTFLAAFAAKI